MIVVVVRLPQQFSNQRWAQYVREAAQTVGEECIYLLMYHVSIDDGIQPRCSRCYDADYNQATDYECTICYGTGFNGGIKKFGRAWSIFKDNESFDELQRKYGEWESDDRSVQMEPGVEVHEHDYLVRVQQWSQNGSPLTFGPRYRIDNNAEITLRTGNRFGQMVVDKVANTMKAHMLHQFHPIHQFNIPLGTPVPRFDATVPF